MLKTSQIAFLIILVIAADAWGQSQRNPERGREGGQTQSQSNEAKQAPATDQRGSDQMPFVIKVLPTKESEEKAASDTNDRKEKMELDRKLVNFNGDLAYYTEVLAWVAALQLVTLIVQAAFLYGTFYIAKIALRDVERARLSGGPIPGTIAIFPNNITKFVIGATNTGRTSATIRNIVVGTTNAEPLSPIPNYSDAAHKKAFNHIVKADGVCFDQHWLIEYPGTELFYCFGYTNYFDIFHRRQVSRFCTSVDPQTRQLNTAGHAAWNEDD
jgi:hypothetical protein